MKLDILVIMAHPDDCEMSCGGTIIKHTREGKKVGVVDLTQGELGTRGTAEIRIEESKKAAQIMGLFARENMKFRDGFFKNDEEHQIQLVKQIRRFQPDIVITNSIKDRHPDHGRAAALVKDTCFLSGLKEIDTYFENERQEAWRPAHLFYAIQFTEMEPHFVVNIGGVVEEKWNAIKAYGSQFHDPDSKEPNTMLSNPKFFDTLQSRWRVAGSYARIEYGEGFLTDRKLALNNFYNLDLSGTP